MANNKLQPHRSIIAVRNFQGFSDRIFVSAFELIFILKLDLTVKCAIASKTQKDHRSKKYFLAISLTASKRILNANKKCKLHAKY